MPTTIAKMSVLLAGAFVTGIRHKNIKVKWATPFLPLDLSETGTALNS
jgi:hypothetical protein